MAIDSVAKRWSMLGFGARRPWPVIGDSVIGKGDRAQFLNLYAGILPAEDTSGTTEYRLYNSQQNVATSNTFSDSTINASLTVIGPVHFLIGTIVERLSFSFKIWWNCSCGFRLSG